jgi:hypothetical protein
VRLGKLTYLNSEASRTLAPLNLCGAKNHFFAKFLLVRIAFVISLVLVTLSLPRFNQLADKQMTMFWTNPLFWMVSVAFCSYQLVSGNYPAFYLSSFNPVIRFKRHFPGRTLCNAATQNISGGAN